MKYVVYSSLFCAFTAVVLCMQELFSTEENIRLLSLTLEERRQQMSDSSTVSHTLTTKDFLHAMTSNEVVDIIAKKLVH